jgi:hypothetical protein
MGLIILSVIQLSGELVLLSGIGSVNEQKISNAIFKKLNFLSSEILILNILLMSLKDYFTKDLV